MANISYAVVLNQNLKLPRLPMEQIELVLDISGAQTDPLSLQQLRSEPSLDDCFKDRRKRINDLIESFDKAMAKAKNDRDAEAVVNLLNKKLEGELDTLQKEMQKRVDDFVAKQKREVNDLFWARARVVVRVSWTALKWTKGLLELGGKGAAAIASGLSVGGAFLSVVALKSLINSYNDLSGLVDELRDAMEEERTTFAKLRDAVKELKKLKKPAPVPQSKIDAVESLLGPYGARLLGVDSAAKASAAKLEKLLDELQGGKFRRKDTADLVEKAIDTLIEDIIQRSKDVAEGRRLLHSAKDTVADASKRAKKDPTSFWDYSGALWKVFDGMLDFGEGSLDKPIRSSLMETIEAKFKDELSDAMIDRGTKF